MPVDPPDTEFDCVGVNGEGSYYTAVVGGVSTALGDYVTAEQNVPECASASHFQTPIEYKYSLRLFSPHYPSHPLAHIIHHHHANFRKDPHRKDYHPRGGVFRYH